MRNSPGPRDAGGPGPFFFPDHLQTGRRGHAARAGLDRLSCVATPFAKLQVMAIHWARLGRDARQCSRCRLACLPLFLTFAPLPIPGQTAANLAQRDFARGIQMHQKGDLQGARQAYEAALKLAPRRVDVLTNLGLVYSQLGQREQAVRCLRKALNLDPRQERVRLNLGIAYMRGQEFEEASRELSRVVAAQPQNYAARHLLGLCFLKLEKFGQGIGELEAVANAQPANLDATYTLASAYIKANQAQKAEAIVEKLKAYDTAEAHFIVGSYDLTILEYRKALTELKRALALNPNLPDLHSQLAYAILSSHTRTCSRAMRNWRRGCSKTN
ncbi:MAG: hypothetical protein DMG24_04675 [Acidobacteria bacterium]|nr:MAG: hypothetical protein DMG24_04675 [Acidobacteriota bacterium]